MITTVDLRKYIATEFFGQRPHVRGHRVPVATLAHSAHSQQWDVTELAYQFSLTETEVLAALLYYEQHREAVEATEAAHQQMLDEMTRQHGS